MTARQLILWRHGETEWNVTGQYQGQANNPLNERGVAQALAAAPRLAALNPARIVASDLMRAQATAQALADLTGLAVDTDPRLREIHVGEWEGLRHPDVFALDPEFEAALRAGRDRRRSSTGETGREAGLRVAAALAEVAAAADDDSVVVIAGHGLSIRLGAFHLMGLDYEAAMRFGHMGNAAWSVVEPRPGYWRLLSYNNVAARP